MASRSDSTLGPFSAHDALYHYSITRAGYQLSRLHVRGAKEISKCKQGHMRIALVLRNVT